MPLYRLKDAG